MQFPVARDGMNDWSWCCKAVLYLAVHLALTVCFFIRPSVFPIKQAVNNGKVVMVISRLLVKWQFHGIFFIPFLISLLVYFTLHFFYIYTNSVCTCLCGCLTLFPCNSDLSHLVLIWRSELALWQLHYKRERPVWIACFLASKTYSGPTVGICYTRSSLLLATKLHALGERMWQCFLLDGGSVCWLLGGSAGKCEAEDSVT